MSFNYITGFVRENNTGRELRILKSISNGILLSKFNNEDGTPFANTEEFVSRADFVSNFTKFDFKIKSSVKEERVTSNLIRSILYQLENHGIIEDSVRDLRAFLFEREGNRSPDYLLVPLE